MKIVIIWLYLILAFSTSLTLNNTITGNFWDIQSVSQDCLVVIDTTTTNYLLTAEQQRKQVDRLKRITFRPWHQLKADNSTPQIQAIFSSYKASPGYGENKLKNEVSWVKKLEKNANLSTYPNLNKKAIALRYTSLRLLPTSKPVYGDFSLPGEGYPFDNLQNSGIAVNTPLYLSHISRDGAWVLAETSYALGWIPISDVAFVDNGFIENWEKSSFITPLRDDLTILDNAGFYRYTANIGSLIPLANNRLFIISDLVDLFFPKNEKEPYAINIVIPDTNHIATIAQGKVFIDEVSNFPHPASLHNMAKLANNLLGQKYGWGDLFDNRDCASSLKDMFASIGLWLPRNGNDQAKTSGQYISLAGLTPTDKEKIILEKGKPFMSLLWFKGHIMLYIGKTPDNKALILHNIWGLRTLDENKKEGRYLIGKTIISTLEPGKDALILQSTLLERLQGLTLLP